MSLTNSWLVRTSAVAAPRLDSIRWLPAAGDQQAAASART